MSKCFILQRKNYATNEIKIEEVDFTQAPKSIAVPRWDGGKHRIYSNPDTLGMICGLPFAYSLTRDGAERLRMAHVQKMIDDHKTIIEKSQKVVDQWEEYQNKLSAEAKPLSKKFGVDFHSAGGALTLRPSDIGEHPSGWVVSGKIKEDWFEWVNEFDAVHPTLGRVWGDFESEVFYTSIEAYEDFRKYFSPEDWDYWDI